MQTIEIVGRVMLECLIDGAFIAILAMSAWCLALSYGHGRKPL